MTSPQQPHPQRVYHATWEEITKLRDAATQEEADAIVESIRTRASHSSAPSRERPKYPQTCDMSKWTPEEIANRLQCAYDKGVREAQQPSAIAAEAPIGMSSEDLLLIAHDEWKRREERKGNHPESHWVTGFIGGFLTDRKWAREYVAALRQRGEQHE